MTTASKYPYVYVWGNNPRRALMKNRRCKIIARGKMNSVEVEFENGESAVISGNALRKKP